MLHEISIFQKSFILLRENSTKLYEASITRQKRYYQDDMKTIYKSSYRALILTTWTFIVEEQARLLITPIKKNQLKKLLSTQYS